MSFFALAYVVPLSIIASMYLLILRFLRSRRRQSMISFAQSTTSGPGGERRRTSYASRVFLAVVVVFGVCWLPLHVHLLLVYMGRQPDDRWYAVFRVIVSIHLHHLLLSHFAPFLSDFFSEPHTRGVPRHLPRSRLQQFLCQPVHLPLRQCRLPSKSGRRSGAAVPSSRQARSSGHFERDRRHRTGDHPPGGVWLHSRCPYWTWGIGRLPRHCVTGRCSRH